MNLTQMNPLYFQEETLQQLKESFAQSNPQILHLPHFLTMSCYESLLKEAQKSQGIHKRIADRYARTEISSFKETSFIQSLEFLHWLSLITSKKLKKVTLKTHQFAHKDYVLIHDSETIRKQLEFFILLMPHWDNHWGGHTVYVSENQGPLVFPLEGNSFSLINKEKDRHKFIQYVNHHAGKEELTMIEGIAE